MRSVNRKRATEIGIAAAAWATLGAPLAVVTGDPLWMLGAIFPAVGVAVAMRIAGTRGLLAGLCFFFVSPGVLGESSLILTLVALVGLAAISLTYRSRLRDRAITPILLAVSFVALAIAILFEGGGPVALAYIGAWCVAVLAISRVDFAAAAIRGLACLIAPLVLSYAVTLLIGFDGDQMGTWSVDGRRLDVYAPFTLTTGGPPFIPGSHRFAPLVGEPGLAAYFLIPILTLIVTASTSHRVRLAAIGAVLVGTVFTQSMGSLIAISAGLVVFFVAHLALNKRRPVAAAILVAAAASMAVPVLYYALGYKAGVAAQSVTDRGIFDAGHQSSAALGNINLVVAYSNDPVVAIAVTCALMAVGIVAVRHAATLLAFVPFTLVGVFSQPSQWQIGAWLLLAMSVNLASQFSEGSVEPPGMITQRQSSGPRDAAPKHRVRGESPALRKDVKPNEP